MRTNPAPWLRIAMLCILLSGWIPRSVQGQTRPGKKHDREAVITGELKQWHKITLSWSGPQVSETAVPNPFTDYRLNVTFTHENGGKTYRVPGYFAADGNAADSGADAGTIWRTHFAPDRTGLWRYGVSFRTDPNVAVDPEEDAGISGGFFDGASGVFAVAASDKIGRDLRAKGRLEYVGGHYLRFAGSGEYFLKQGADAPENFLSYRDFDGDFKTDGKDDQRIKSWAPHEKDWRPGDPTWRNGKGKGLIGAINYLASEGMNVFSFLTMNINGDDKNAFPYVTYNGAPCPQEDRQRFDCSRLDQWARVLDHGTAKGMFLHFKTQERENQTLLDDDLDGRLSVERRLYYRELIARFGHNLALNWNLGEEMDTPKAPTPLKKAWAQYLYDTDPYHHHIVIHNGSNHYDLLGPDAKLTGFSVQTSKPDFRQVHGRVKEYLRRSVEAGKPWAVACDEPGDASHALRPDNDAGDSQVNGRKNALWGTLLGGGWGNEWYFGYKHDQSDLTCEDWRSRDQWWDVCRYALEFFEKTQVPFWEMTNDNERSSATEDYCFYKPGEVYLVYLKNGGTTTLDLGDADGTFLVRWYDPRHGGDLAQGSVTSVRGGGARPLGDAPAARTEDWLVLVTRR